MNTLQYYRHYTIKVLGQHQYKLSLFGTLTAIAVNRFIKCKSVWNTDIDHWYYFNTHCARLSNTVGTYSACRRDSSQAFPRKLPGQHKLTEDSQFVSAVGGWLKDRTAQWIYSVADRKANPIKKSEIKAHLMWHFESALDFLLHLLVNAIKVK